MNDPQVEEFEGFEILWNDEGHYVKYDVYLGDEMYLTGHTKWDGCTEIDQFQTHWCGGYGLSLHLLLVQHLYTESLKMISSVSQHDPLTVSIVRN